MERYVNTTELIKEFESLANREGLIMRNCNAAGLISTNNRSY